MTVYAVESLARGRQEVALRKLLCPAREQSRSPALRSLREASAAALPASGRSRFRDAHALGQGSHAFTRNLCKRVFAFARCAFDEEGRAPGDIGFEQGVSLRPPRPNP